MGASAIHVIVACRDARGTRQVRAIRAWLHRTDDPASKGAVQHVDKATDPCSALRGLAARVRDTIFITVGYGEAEARDILGRAAPSGLEAIILLAAPSGAHAPAHPSASLLEASPFLAFGDPMPALRKSILRLHARSYASIRELETLDDLRAHFSLRYRVWKRLRYIQDDKHCPQSQWELDFTDRTAEPIGAFSATGRLIGCARLVRGIGVENPHQVSLIDRLIEEKHDPCLRRNFQYPETIQHPYDILESFPRFRDYYKGLVKNGVPKAEVSRVIVKPGHRRAGLGEVVVDSLVSVASCLDVKVLFLACLRKHQRFYERCGFRTIPDLECDSFVNVRVPAIAMERWLVPKPQER